VPLGARPGLSRLSRLCACLLAASCASAGDPPGGPPDVAPPVVTAVSPESGAVLTAPPSEASITFDEVVNERIAAQPGDISGAVLLSPTTERVNVGWHRNRISLEPHGGFKPGRIYHIELLPVITDLRQNRIKTRQVWVFSTGPAIPAGRLEGALVDWVQGRAAPLALVEADLMPDSLPYRTLTDSTGYFRMDAMPPGRYVVWGIMDSNNDRRLGGREAFDTATVTLDSIAATDLYAFVHDSLGPRLRDLESVDSLTLKLTFTQALPADLAIDTAQVTLAPAEDTTAKVTVLGVLTQAGLDSLQARARHAADSVAAAAAAHRDSTARRDTTARQGPARPAAPRPGPQPGARGAPRPATAGARSPLDSTRAQKMLARRPAPSDARFLRLATPLDPDKRYVVIVEGVRNLAGAVNTARSGGYRPPRPRAPATEPRDTTSRRDTTLRRDTTARVDTTARRDSTTRRDSTHLR